MTCPNCGEEVPAKAKVCPECGSCEETGWSEEAATSGLGLPEEKFDYDDFVKREFEEEVAEAARHDVVLVDGGDCGAGGVSGIADPVK